MKRLTLTGLLPGNEYAVQIKALNAETESGWSRKFVFVTNSDVVTPKTPANVTWLPGNGVFIAEWDKVTQNVDNTIASISKYEIELTNTLNSVKKIESYDPPLENRHVWTVTPERLKTLFGSIIFSVGFRVRAVNFSGNVSAWSPYLTAIMGQPDPPTNAVVVELDEAIKVSWTPPVNMANVAGYRVYVSTTAGFTPAPANMIYQGESSTYTYNTSTFFLHYFKIRSYSGFGTESIDLTAQGTPKSPYEVDTVPPSVPTGLAVTTDRTGNVAKANLTWAFNAATVGNEDIQAFVIKWYKSGEPTKYSLEYVDKASRSVSIPLPQAYSDYLFQIAAVDFVANYSAYSATVTLSNAVPGPPTAVTGLTSSTGMDSISLRWTASASGDVVNGGFYKVTLATDAGFTVGVLNYETGNTNITVSGLASNVTYYYRVIATDSTALDSTAVTGSALTDSFPVTPLSDGNPPASSPAATVTGGIGYIHVSWLSTTNNDMVTYEVHISTTAGFTPTLGSSTKVAEQTGTSVVLEKDAAGAALVYGTTYYIRLIAKDLDTTAGNAPVAGTVGSATPTKATIVDLILVPSDIGAYTQAETTSFISTARTGAVTDVKTLWGHPLNTTLIDGGDIYTNTVKATAIAIADFTNYIADGDLSDPNFINWSTSGNPVRVAAVTTTPAYLKWIAGSPGNNHIYNNHNFEVFPGDSFYFKCEVSTPATNTVNLNVYGAIRTVDAAGAVVGWPQLAPAVLAPNIGWTTYEGTVTVPAGNSITAQFDPFANSTVAGQEVRMRRMTLRRRNGGELIVDGSVAANKITAGSYTGGAFVLDTGGIIRTAGSEVVITSTGITVGAGATGGISASKLTTGTFGSGESLTVNGNMTLNGNMTILASGTIKSNNYVANTTGFSLGAAGLDIRTGTIAVGTLIGGTISSQTITLGTGGAMVVDSTAVIRSNNWNGTSTGWQLSSTGLTVYGLNARLNASNIDGDTVSGRALTVTSGGYIQSSNYNGSSTGWQISSAGFTMYNGTISGTSVTTNALTSITNDAVTGLPLFSINAGGYAAFSGARIYGNTVLGNASSHYVQSGNYSPGAAGWKLWGDGSVEFGSGTFRGALSGATGTFAGSLSAVSGTFTGTLSGASGTFSGTVSGGTVETGAGNFGTVRMTGSSLKSYDGGGSNIVTIDGTNEFQVRGNAAFYQHLTTGVGTFTVGSNVTATFNGAANFNTGINAIGGSTIGGGLTISTVGLVVSAGDVTINSISNASANDLQGVALTIGNSNYGYVVVGSGGKLFRSEAQTYASALKLKENIKPLEITAKQVVSLKPYRYNFKSRPEQSKVGFIADYADELGLHDWVAKDEEGEVAGFNYIDFSIAQQVVLIDHDERVERLEEEKAKLEDRVTTLESKITQLLLALDK